jgi:hypothetical protein
MDISLHFYYLFFHGVRFSLVCIVIALCRLNLVLFCYVISSAVEGNTSSSFHLFAMAFLVQILSLFLLGLRHTSI